MTKLSDHLREIAAGASPRKAMFDEYAPSERSFPEFLQGVADAIEDEYEEGVPTDVEPQDDVWLPWAVCVACDLGVNPETEPDVLREHIAEAVDGVVRGGAVMVKENMELQAQVRMLEEAKTATAEALEAAPAWFATPWPMYDTGEPVMIGDFLNSRTVARVAVSADEWTLYDSAPRAIAKGAVGEPVAKPDSWERVVGDLHAMGYTGPQLDQLLDLLDRARRVAA